MAEMEDTFNQKGKPNLVKACKAIIKIIDKLEAKMSNTQGVLSLDDKKEIQDIVTGLNVVIKASDNLQIRTLTNTNPNSVLKFGLLI